MQAKYFTVVLAGVALFAHIYEAFGVNTDTQYTTKETQALKQLRKSVDGLLYTDYQKLDSYLIHFLRRKNLDVSETVKLLRENFKWRKQNKVDEILQEKEMIEMEKKFPVTVDGVDKKGRPVLSYVLNKWDVRRFLLAGRFDEFRRYQIYILEKISERVYNQALAGKDVSQYNILIDLSGFNSRQHACLPCLQGLSDIVPLITTHYPEFANSVIFVNAPRAFEAVLSLVKGFLHQRQKAQISVYGYDKSEWRAALEKLYDNDQIAVAFGGTRARRFIN